MKHLDLLIYFIEDILRNPMHYFNLKEEIVSEMKYKNIKELLEKFDIKPKAKINIVDTQNVLLKTCLKVHSKSLLKCKETISLLIFSSLLLSIPYVDNPILYFTNFFIYFLRTYLLCLFFIVLKEYKAFNINKVGTHILDEIIIYTPRIKEKDANFKYTFENILIHELTHAREKREKLPKYLEEGFAHSVEITHAIANNLISTVDEILYKILKSKDVKTFINIIGHIYFNLIFIKQFQHKSWHKKIKNPKKYKYYIKNPMIYIKQYLIFKKILDEYTFLCYYTNPTLMLMFISKKTKGSIYKIRSLLKEKNSIEKYLIQL